MYYAVLGEFMHEVKHFLFVPLEGIQVEDPYFVVEFFVGVLEDQSDVCFLLYTC